MALGRAARADVRVARNCRRGRNGWCRGVPGGGRAFRLDAAAEIRAGDCDRDGNGDRQRIEYPLPGTPTYLFDPAIYGSFVGAGRGSPHAAVVVVAPGS